MQVSTRWYRAPEILFASRHYSLSVDMWSTGAVIAELFSLFPLFPGSNDIDQIFRVFQVMGSPTPDTWEVMRFTDVEERDAYYSHICSSGVTTCLTLLLPDLVRV